MIKLTEKSDYAIRTLVYLAEHAGSEERVTNQILSQAFRVSPNHLYKVVQALGRGGYLSTSAGRTGGIKLIKPAGKITLLEIIKLIEGPIHLSKCILDLDECHNAPAGCRLRNKIAQAQAALVKVFQEATIEELIEDKLRLEADCKGNPAGTTVP